VASPLIDLDSFLPYRIAVLANVMGAAIAAAYVERYGLTVPEWRVIAVLTRYPGLSAREVAQKTHMDAVAVSRAVNRALAAGRLRRGTAHDDRRRSVLQVSEAGAAVYREVAPVALDFERALLDALPSSDRQALERAISTLTERAVTLSAALRNRGATSHGAAAPRRRVAPAASRRAPARP
jgi:DNA-binding MarR family transcriptional regulator